MRLRAKPRRGHDYYSVVTSVRSADNVREKTILYIGRIDKLTENKRLEIVKKLKKLDNPELISKFHSILFSIGYEFPSPVSSLEIVDVYSYGRELALHKVCEEIDLVNTINRFSTKGGGPELGKIVEAMAINRNCDPCSYFRLSDWYKQSALPFFLKLLPSDLTYSVALNALDYLQPVKTIKMQASLYENIRKTYGYECERLDIDLTSTYFEGNGCILAKFGYSRDNRPDKLQIVIAFVVDQKGVFVTHRVWPGNQTDAKSLEPVDRSLNSEFGLDAPRVVDRGMATWANLDQMDESEERYLVALRAGVKTTGLLDEIGTPRDDWASVGDDQVAASAIRGRRKYVVVWNAAVAETNRKERESRVEKAEEDLKKIQASVESGKIDSEKERDERVGFVIKKRRVTRYLGTKNEEGSLKFVIERKKAFEDVKPYDGYQVFVTTEFDLSEKEVVESYKTRDMIEKAIRTLKSALGLHPQNVRTEEHVLGNIFVCATAFQLRSILGIKLKDVGVDMSVENAMKTLERLKAVHIVVGTGAEIEVHKKLSGLDSETRTLVEIFSMADGDKLPDVEV
jgi:transposase